MSLIRIEIDRKRPRVLLRGAIRGSFPAMSFDPTFYARTLGQSASIRELSRVALTAPYETEDGSVLPEGSEGTIVGTWARGAAYEVEFTKPFAALVTVEPEHFRITTDPAF